MEMKKHEILEQKMCKELEKIATRYENNPGTEMNPQDLCLVKDLYSALMKQSTWISMKEAEEYEEGGFSSSNGNMNSSGYRGRAANGRFVSRDKDQNYADGYSEGYSEAMNQMNGGMHRYPRW